MYQKKVTRPSKSRTRVYVEDITTEYVEEESEPIQTEDEQEPIYDGRFITFPLFSIRGGLTREIIRNVIYPYFVYFRYRDLLEKKISPYKAREAITQRIIPPRAGEPGEYFDRGKTLLESEQWEGSPMVSVPDFILRPFVNREIPKDKLMDILVYIGMKSIIGGKKQWTISNNDMLKARMAGFASTGYGEVPEWINELSQYKLRMARERVSKKYGMSLYYPSVHGWAFSFKLTSVELERAYKLWIASKKERTDKAQIIR